jgi:hypothetical protein
MKRFPLSALSILLVASLFACGTNNTPSSPRTGPVMGTTATLAGEAVEAWTTLNDLGVVTDVTVKIAAAALDTAASAESTLVTFPDEVAAQTFFNHFVVDFDPAGHPPGPYLTAHFDLHFYGITNQERVAIDCQGEPLPEGLTAGTPANSNDYVPNFFLIPDTSLSGPDSDGTCVPQMGVHAVDVRSPEMNPEAPAAFTETYIIGYHKGRMAFLEPMITQEFFTSRPELSWDVPRPALLGRAVLWPGSFSAFYNAEDDMYELTFSEFSDIE